jgi:hypothetical protein
MTIRTVIEIVETHIEIAPESFAIPKVESGLAATAAGCVDPGAAIV